MDQAVKVEIDLNSTVNFAMQQNEVAILRSLRLTNTLETPLEGLTIAVETEPQFAQPWTTRLEKLETGETRVISPIDLCLLSQFLWRVSERVVGSVLVQVKRGEEVLARGLFPIEVLAHDEWPGLRVLPEILAAFVLPNHPSVETVLARASALLREWTGDGSLSGYQSKERERALYMGAAIFGALQQAGISYSNPPASFEQCGQKIRLPDRILENRLGSCLDLSTFYAACLEQAGLFPIVVLLQGHAFAGFWLIEESFQDCAVEDPLSIRKRVDLGEICLVETTLLTQNPPVQFNQATNRAKSHLADLSRFSCAIDIQRARKSRIRPIALHPQDGEAPTSGLESASMETPASGEPPRIQRPSVGGGTTTSTTQAPAEPPAARLEKWKRKLLDLSLRNRLINFRDSKKTLRILAPSLAALEDALADGEKFQILPNLDRLDPNGVRSQELYASRLGRDGVQEILQQEFLAKRLHGSAQQGELDRRLLEIYRAAKTGLEEGGSSALYIALGFLEWYESPSSQVKRTAPIILLPLVLERRSVQEGFRLRQSDEEPRINTTLLEMLREDFQLSIEQVDPIPTDEHGIDVAGILRSFREAIKNTPRWDVAEEAQIGLFSFAKYLMWLDLQVRAQDLKKNKVVSHLIDSPQCPFGSPGDFPDPSRLDETYPPTDTFCPLDCDSSQLAAVHAADEEKSFVLEGPPGTGKSQTITNIIAHCLAKGKSVLFVSEKMAALNVVHTRLSQVGLGPFCLELHSNKAQKAHVVEQLGSSLDLARTMSSDEWARLAEQLAASRSELNRYVVALHSLRDSGESIFHGLSQLTALRDFLLVDLNWSKDRTTDPDFLRQLREVTDRLRVAGESIGHPCGNVWASSTCETWTPGLTREIESSIGRFSNLIPELTRSATEAGALLLLGESGWDWSDLDTMVKVCDFLMTSPAPPPAMLVSRDWDSAKAAISEWIGHGRQRDGLRSKVMVKYGETVLHLDLQPIEERLLAAEKAWGPIKWFKALGLQRALKPVLQPGMKVSLDTLGSELEQIRALKKEEYLLSKAGDDARGLLGQLLWKDGEADWSRLEQLQDWSDGFARLVAAAAGTNLDRSQELRNAWSRIATEGRAALGSDQPIGRVLSSYSTAYAQFCEACRALEAKAALDPTLAWGGREVKDAIPRSSNQLESWRQRLPDFQSWCNWRRVRRDALKLDLGTVVQAFEGGRFATSDLARVVARSFYQWWVDVQIEREPTLSDFFGPEHERKISAFRELDTAYTRLARKQVQALLSARVPSPQGQAAGQGEVGTLLRQRGRRRGVMPIRTLFQNIPNLLPRLKPCLLMSPLSVAQYLDPAHPPFDLVVFDEASQIPVWDAVGAIARGKEVIIVGDPKQLPPTSFFNRSDDPDAADEETVEDLESILDDCMAAQLPLHRLDWHYRSRHESLIAFSNQQYYGNRLLTFPSPHREIGVSWHSVPTGVYDRAGARVNRAEAEAVVAEVCRRLRDPLLSQYTIGVVTFSIAQQTLIEDLLEVARRAEPAVDQGFSDERPEPVFIKNLENVQGDERDVILFSICYGPDSTGRVAMNFGPLNKLGGERRLNVAITRARRELLVFSTLRADQIDLSRTRATGVADLRTFLDFAERGQRALREASGPSAHSDFESPFERDVCEALRARGHQVDVQVGCSGYRIDLAVIDPNYPGRYLIGIECDGAFYHSARTARDRDRLRQAILSDLGWKLHRVWSSDWWNNREASLAKIEAAIQAAASSASTPPHEPPTQERYAAAPRVGAVPEENPQGPPQIAAPTVKTLVQTAESTFDVYQPHPPLPIRGGGADFYAPASRAAVASSIEAIVSAEGPVSLQLCARKVMAGWGLKRLTPAVLSRIGECIPAGPLRSQACTYGTFLWPSTLVSTDWPGLRLPGSSEDSIRDAEDLPPEEIANGAMHILSQQVAMPVAALVKETARLFGIRRVGSTVDQVMQEGISLLVVTGRAKQNGESVAVS